MRIENLWIFYLFAYAVAFPLRQWANAKRGEPIEDPEFLRNHKSIVIAAMIWLIGGFVISLFAPTVFNAPFLVGLAFYILGLAVAVFAFYSFAHQSGLVTGVLYRYSRNPNYVGWIFLIFGLCLMSWSSSLWSISFFVYFIITVPYLHWTVLLEEHHLAQKHGDSYRRYLASTPRYFGVPKEDHKDSA
jgi:protein-S-isoprenylcysteine O-methyltransferase Ste14